MTKLITSDKSAICNRTERFSRMRRQNAPMLVFPQPGQATSYTRLLRDKGGSLSLLETK